MLLRFCFLIFFGCFLSAEELQPPKVLVSVAPYRYFVNQIAGDLVDVGLMVPAGASAHTFEPTPKQMISASNAKMWFRLGEPFEEKAINAIKSVNPNLDVIDLRQGITLLHGKCAHVHAGGHCSNDLHLWLSPKIAKIQSKVIADALISHFPEQKEKILTKLNLFLKELDNLDHFIQDTLKPVKNRVLLVSHPAYAYYCQDYQFNQLSIEFEGRDPTAKQLTELLKKAKSARVNFILTQPQYSDKAASLIAGQIKAELISVDPYSEHYDETLRSITKIIADHS